MSQFQIRCWRALLAALVLVAAACGTSRPAAEGNGTDVTTGPAGPTITGPATGSSDTAGSGTSPAGGSTGPTGTNAIPAPCTTATLEPVVAAALDSGIVTVASVTISECRNGYARVFAHAVQPNNESEQVFLHSVGGRWTYLTSGTGITCESETDFRPAELEDACLALGLRPTLSTYTDLVTRQAVAAGLALPAGAHNFACTTVHGGLGAGGIQECRPDPEPTEGQFPILVALVLDDRAHVAWAQAGVENPGLNPDLLRDKAKPGLNCTQLQADPEFTRMAAIMNDRTTYFAAVEYWFLEGRPGRMDADSNGIPCETRFDAAVVKALWAGGEVR